MLKTFIHTADAVFVAILRNVFGIATTSTLIGDRANDFVTKITPISLPAITPIMMDTSEDDHPYIAKKDRWNLDTPPGGCAPMVDHVMDMDGKMYGL